MTKPKREADREKLPLESPNWVLYADAFDRAYMQDMVKDHDKDVAAFKRASTMAADADLKAWAAKTLPTLEEHQKQAKSINAKLGPASGASKAPAAQKNE